MNINAFQENLSELRRHRITEEAMTLTGLDTAKKERIPQNLIISKFHDFYNFFNQKNLNGMMKTINILSGIAKKQIIYDFDEFETFNLAEIFIKVLYIHNHQIHITIIRFLVYLFQHDEPPLLKYFVEKGIINSLLFSVQKYLDNEEIVLETFHIIYEIALEKSDVMHQFVKFQFLDLFLLIFRNDSFSKSMRIAIFNFLTELAEEELSYEELDNILMITRNILEDHQLIFLWESAFDTLFSLIADQKTAQYIMIEKDFCSICNDIFSNCSENEILTSVISVLSSYFHYSNTIIPFNYEKMLGCLSILNDKYICVTLKTISNIIVQGHIKELFDMKFLGALKSNLQDQSYNVKQEILYVIGNIIRNIGSDYISNLIQYDFMDDFIQMLDTQDLKFFNFVIGIITKLLRSNVKYDPFDIFWIQFEQNNGVEKMQELAFSSNGEMSERAERFLNKLYSLRPQNTADHY
ncbi:hypothetical protein TRFO_08764 [Tritrichomonas foetus]|uniref:Uncharacterized protein n=1 Tax=Tritrichomonas foetus TaxID=1144522 RepID=A0A1J4JI04_9EUKA|nr:hypothetical protein TRFO_08764 [Tritrichomonas foetus]|eukprot:OHS98750.1 hypothetical protein TRFO_08764 [Tritrichomonas foetus]